MNKTYSKYDLIPKGKATEALTEGCLVLEGGAFRGLYTQGFLDAMMMEGINLSCVIGVSAGALGGMNYVSGQIGRSARINIGFRHDSRYVGLKAFLHSHSILDVSFLTEDRGIIPEPLDEERFYRPEQRFIAVATNAETGEPTYFEKGHCHDIINATRASGTMPYISPPVLLDGVPYFDGACSCSIPYEWALAEGYEKIIVIRTRDIFYRAPEEKHSLALKMYRQYPDFAAKLIASDHDYNRQIEEIERLQEAGRLLRIAPLKPITVDRLEKDVEKLGDLYWEGYEQCLAQAGELREYLLG